MSTGGGAGDQWERLRDRAEMRGRERRRGWKRREGHRGLSGSQPWRMRLVWQWGRRAR